MKKTEMRNPNSTHIDKMSTAEMLKVMSDENYNVAKAVEDALPSIGAAIDAAYERFKNGGRIFYMGCGTSGRLGVLDASEAPPTYGISPDRLVGIIAGGPKCLTSASENQEDLGEMGIRDLKEHGVTGGDVVVGISVAGDAAYVADAIQYAKSLGCVTIGITSNADSLVDKYADYPIVTDTGAEVIAGSTRMKAGTAHKIVLNMISTSVMIKSGYVYENLMVNMKAKNIKLMARMISMVHDITGLDNETAESYLKETDWNIRAAIALWEERK